MHIGALIHAAIGHTFRFLGDNATSRRAMSVLQELENHGIETLHLQLRSPDCTSIENIWNTTLENLRDPLAVTLEGLPDIHL